MSVFFFVETVWNVWVWTSDMRGAGTDANVFMTLYETKEKQMKYHLVMPRIILNKESWTSLRSVRLFYPCFSSLVFSATALNCLECV